MARSDLSVFLSYAFAPEGGQYTQSSILSLVEKACLTAEAGLHRSFPNLRFALNVDQHEYDQMLNAAIRQSLAAADIVIVDVSENNPNVFYELGLAHALGKPAILIQAEADSTRVPSDIQGSLRLQYRHIEDIRGRLAENVERVARQVLATRDDPVAQCSQVWSLVPSGATHRSIVIVGPRVIGGAGAPAQSSPNFTYLARFGDKDAIVELSILLARLYPRSPLVRYVSDELPQDSYEQNLVVVGGPGSGSADGNSLAPLLHERMGIPVSYSDDFEAMLVAGEPERRSTLVDDVVTEDHGFFARFTNPFNPDARVVVLHGIHTSGVLGAARLLSDHPAAEANVRLVLDRCGPDAQFWATFPVPVVARAAMVPKLLPEHLRPF